jgi:hypothetical protein
MLESGVSKLICASGVPRELVGICGTPQVKRHMTPASRDRQKTHRIFSHLCIGFPFECAGGSTMIKRRLALPALNKIAFDVQGR